VGVGPFDPVTVDAVRRAHVVLRNSCQW